MKKIRLDAESLRVESFRTEALEGAHGTVHGKEATVPATPCYSCASCVGECSSIPNPCFCTEGRSCRCN